MWIVSDLYSPNAARSAAYTPSIVTSPPLGSALFLESVIISLDKSSAISRSLHCSKMDVLNSISCLPCCLRCLEFFVVPSMFVEVIVADRTGVAIVLKMVVGL
jgi:hypothetical protein